MHPICLHIGRLPIYWYGVMTALAFLICLAHLIWLGKQEGRSAEFVSDLTIWIMLGGIGGARLAYVLAEWPRFAVQPQLILRLDQGGLIYYGGFIGAALLVAIMARRKREPLWPLADFVVTALPLGHAMGRIGCFLNGCCYGLPAVWPWSVRMHGLLRHPVQLYEASGNLVLYALLLYLYRHRTRPGRIFALYLILYPLLRFSLEFLRGDERLSWRGLTLAQLISLGLMLCGLGLWCWLKAPRQR